MLLRVGLLVGIAGCWHAATPPPLPAPITVRMAAPNEIPPAPSVSPSSTQDRLREAAFPDRACNVEGRPAPELRAPIIAFAREHLVAEIDRFTGYATADRSLETPEDDTFCDGGHRDGGITVIRVTPKSGIGELRVSQHDVFRGHCSWGAELTYCLHVQAGPSGTTVVVEKHYSIIGQRSAPRAGPRGACRARSRRGPRA